MEQSSDLRPIENMWTVPKSLICARKPTILIELHKYISIKESFSSEKEQFLKITVSPVLPLFFIIFMSIMTVISLIILDYLCSLDIISMLHRFIDFFF